MVAMAAFAGLSPGFRALIDDFCPWCYRNDYFSGTCPDRFLDFVETYAGWAFLSEAIAKAAHHECIFAMWIFFARDSVPFVAVLESRLAMSFHRMTWLSQMRWIFSVGMAKVCVTRFMNMFFFTQSWVVFPCSHLLI